MALSTITGKQAKGTKSTMKKCKQLLDYLATHPNVTVQFHASDMILNVHSDPSYLSEVNPQSCLQPFFHGMETRCHKTHQIKWGVFHPLRNFTIRHCICRRGQTWRPIPKLQTSHFFLLTLKKMGHPQPPTPINCDNSTAVGIANNTVKRHCSRSMEMQFVWVADAVAQGKFDIKYFSGKENLADYQGKHHTGTHHVAVCPWYLHKPKSERKLPRACKPSTLKGCVGNLLDGYVHTNPLPQVPTKQSVPTSGKRLLPYLRIPVLIPALRRLISPE
jgi:hypothetical protein